MLRRVINSKNKFIDISTEGALLCHRERNALKPHQNPLLSNQTSRAQSQATQPHSSHGEHSLTGHWTSSAPKESTDITKSTRR